MELGAAVVVYAAGSSVHRPIYFCATFCRCRLGSVPGHPKSLARSRLRGRVYLFSFRRVLALVSVRWCAVVVDFLSSFNYERLPRRPQARRNRSWSILPCLVVVETKAGPPFCNINQAQKGGPRSQYDRRSGAQDPSRTAVSFCTCAGAAPTKGATRP